MLATPTQNTILQAALTAICPVGKVERMYVGVAGSGFISNAIAGLNLTAYWVSLDSGFTVGSAASGANIAQAWAQSLFTHLWANDTTLALLTSVGGASVRGASAATDWSANKRLTLPDARGRSLIGLGQGSGLSSRALGAKGGAETHALSTAENGPHSHGVTDPGHNHLKASNIGSAGSTNIDSTIWPYFASLAGPTNFFTNGNTTGITVNSAGSGSAHNNMQPWLAVQHVIFAGFA